jgi:hypothetical protein
MVAQMWWKAAQEAGLYEFGDDFWASTAQRVRQERVCPDSQEGETSVPSLMSAGCGAEIEVCGRGQYPTQRDG